MFSLFKTKNDKHQQIILKLSGLHCVSCAVNIDLTLEDLPGVISSKTNYAKMISTITYDPEVITTDQFSQAISELGYNIL